LSLDYGTVRVGLAIADRDVRVAEPLGTFERVNRNEDMRRLREMAREHGVSEIVIGLPLNLDGSRGPMAEQVRAFARRVRKQVAVPVVLVDERLTSWEAERVMEEEFKTSVKTGSGPAGKGKERVTLDAVAAVLILREYLSGAHAEAVEIGKISQK
jgi:putative holliday junction resolvase